MGTPIGAAHGAGQRMSRTQAKQSVSEGGLRRLLRDKGVALIGGGLDEAPRTYQDIHQAMTHQRDLVEVLGSFTRRIGRIAAGGSSKYGGE